MAMASSSSSSTPLFFMFLTIIFFFSCSEATRSFPANKPTFLQAPHFHSSSSCSNSNNEGEEIHIAMTLDSKYFRGTVAAIFSLLNHSSCPDQLRFHFIVDDDATDSGGGGLLLSIFPSLRFSLHPFLRHRRSLSPLISSSVRKALENPLNYARNYLPDLLPPSITKVIYLDSDVLLVDDIAHLYWNNNASATSSSSVIAAPEYCHVDFRRYFNKNFWEKGGMEVFKHRRRRSAGPCYFNTGVMVIRLDRWREGGYTRRIERWMGLQREERMYELGSLPPLLLAFAGDVDPVDHRWNQHGLGGDNATGECREVHPGPVSLLHWSGRAKPWDRLDQGAPCPVDLLWKPYDLFIRGSSYPTRH